MQKPRLFPGEVFLELKFDLLAYFLKTKNLEAMKFQAKPMKAAPMAPIFAQLSAEKPN